MIVLNATAESSTASTPIAVTQLMNTNSGLALDTKSNMVQVVTPGIYEIVGSVCAESVASGNYGVEITVNGTMYGNINQTLASAANELATVPVYAVVDIIETTVDGYATISILPIGAPEIIGGTISIKKIS